MKTTLCIGCFDIEKAFGKVSIYILFKKLIAYGIGYIMLNALKTIYNNTSCILNIQQKYQRQSASSSSLLFVIFIYDFVEFIRKKYDPELLIESLHCLLHAGDALLICTIR